MNRRTNYYTEALLDAASECGLQITPEQAKEIGESIVVAVECEGMAFYSPPASSRFHDEQRNWKQKYDALKAEFDRYQDNAETAVKSALGQRRDTPISIGDNGSVTRCGGRSEQIL